MTAVTFIADEPDLTQRVAVTRADMTRASTTYLRAGELISYDDLLHLTLIASDNAAARVLARTSEGGTAAFVARMNEMATQLGLTNTHYADPSGLDASNVSSAYDISHLIAFAAIRPSGSVRSCGPASIEAQHEPARDHRSTAPTSSSAPTSTCVGGKTGFISKAGYCLATLLRSAAGSAGRRRRARRRQQHHALLGSASPLQLGRRPDAGHRWRRADSPKTESSQDADRRSTAHDRSLGAYAARTVPTPFSTDPGPSRPASRSPAARRAARADDRVGGRAVGEDRRARRRRRRAAGGARARSGTTSRSSCRAIAASPLTAAIAVDAHRARRARRRTRSRFTSLSPVAAPARRVRRLCRRYFDRDGLYGERRPRLRRQRRAVRAARAPPRSILPQRRLGATASTSSTRTTGRRARAGRWLRTRSGALAAARAARVSSSRFTTSRIRVCFRARSFRALGLAVGRLHARDAASSGAVQLPQGGHHLQRLRHDRESDLRARDADAGVRRWARGRAAARAPIATSAS